MKPIQITMDEDLLAALDATEAVQRDGRSAVLRRAASEYLVRLRESEIAESYRRAYGEPTQEGTEVDELEGWAVEGQWPES